MKRRLLFALMLLAVALNKGKAQELIIDSVTNEFPGLFSAADGDITFTYNIIGRNSDKKTATLVLIYMNGQMKEFNKTYVEIPKLAVVQGCVFMMNGFAYCIADPAEKTRTITRVDFSGNVIFKETESGVPIELLGADSKVVLQACMPEGLLAIYPKNTKKTTYAKLHWGPDNKLESTQEITMENGKPFEIIETKGSRELMVLLKKELLDTKQAKYVYAIDIIDANSGNIVATNTLKEGDLYMMPASVTVQENTVCVAGLCYKEGKFAAGKAQGLMICQLLSAANAPKISLIAMNKLGDFLPDAAISAVAEGGTLLVEDVFTSMDGGMVVVSELLTRKMTEKEVEIDVSNLMLIKLNNEDNSISKLQIIPGNTDRQLIMKGWVSNTNMLDASEWIYKNRLTSYKHANVMGRQSICYMSLDPGDGTKKINVTAVDSPVQLFTSDILTLRLPDPKGKMRGGKKILVDSSVPTTTKVNEWEYIDVYPGGGDKVKLYNLLVPQLLVARENIILKNGL